MAKTALDLPPQAAALIGNGFFNGPPRPTDPWWLEVTRERPKQLRSDAVAALLARPGAGLRALGVGLQATTRADLPYLAATPADPTRPTAEAGDPGWSGAVQPDLHRVLRASATTGLPPWGPSVLVLVALAAAASTALWRRRAPGAARWCVAAGLGALTALGLVAAALWGDGYFEVFKHVWLAAYVLTVSALCLLGALVHLPAAALATALTVRYSRFSARRAPSTSASSLAH